MRDPAEVLVEFRGGEPPELAELAQAHPEDVTILKAKGFEAFNHTVEALVILGPVIVVQLGSVIKTHLETSRQVRIRVGGTEIEGVTADKAIEILEAIQVGDEPLPDDA